MPTLAILGTWRAPEDSALYAFGAAAAEAAAGLGWNVSTGGYSGVMDAGLRGARAGGGQALAHTWTGLDGVLAVSPHASEVRAHARIASRVGSLIGEADACLVLPGRMGTVAELALALECRAKGELARPVMVYGGFWASFFDWLDASNARLEFDTDRSAPVLHRRVDHPADVAAVLRADGA